MKSFLAREREREKDFRLAGDGVHADSTGHAIIAREILSAWNFPPTEVSPGPGVERAFAPDPRGMDVLRLVQEKQRLLKDAWLTSTGHRRPGMKKGLPLDEAEGLAGKLEAEIVDRTRPGT